MLKNKISRIALILFFCILFFFTNNIYAVDTQKNISLISEYVIYPNTLLKSIGFEELYNIPNIALALGLFQNNLDRKLNNGFFGIDFNAPVKLEILTIDNMPAPVCILKFKAANIEKIKLIIPMLTKNEFTLTQVSPQDKTNYFIKSNNSNAQSKFEIPCKYINKNFYILFDLAAAIKIFDLKFDGSESLANTALDKTEQNKLITDFIQNEDKITANNSIPTDINLTAADILAYQFINVNAEYLNNLYKIFKIDFLKDFINEVKIDKQLLLIRKIPKQLKIENYSFSENSEKAIILNFDEPIFYKLPNNTILLYSAAGEILELEKLINKFITNQDLKELVLNIIKVFKGKIICYITAADNNKTKETSNLSAATYAQEYPLSLLIEINDIQEFKELLKSATAKYLKDVNITEIDNLIELSLTAVGAIEPLNLYCSFLDNANEISQKFAIITSNKSELERLKISNKSSTSLISTLKTKKIINDKTHNSLFYADLKNIFLKLTANVNLPFPNTLKDYFVNKLDTLYSYTTYLKDRKINSLIIQQENEINFVELYNLYFNVNNANSK